LQPTRLRAHQVGKRSWQRRQPELGAESPHGRDFIAGLARFSGCWDCSPGRPARPPARILSPGRTSEQALNSAILAGLAGIASVARSDLLPGAEIDPAHGVIWTTAATIVVSRWGMADAGVV